MATHIETSGAAQAKDCGNLFRFLAFSGVRINEARHVTWADVNFEQGPVASPHHQKRKDPLGSVQRELARPA
jgi:integrase